MLDFIVLSVASFTTWLNSFRQPQLDLQPLKSISWSQSALFQEPKFTRDRLSPTVIDRYLQNLSERGFDRNRQGIWMQSGWDVSASNLGTIPLPAASLTKIATTLAALDSGEQNINFPRIFLLQEK